MVEQIINSLKQVLALSAFLLLVAPSFSQECLSLGNGNWGNTANWNCGGVNRLPACGDIVKIQAGHTVTVANQYNLLGCGSSMIVDVTGTLQFTTGNKLQLPCGSILSIQTGGVVRKSTPGGGSSTLISICGANEWTAGDGELNTPQSFGGEILPVELISFEGRVIDQNAHLSWSTASEHNNDFYTLYQSKNALGWELIEELEAKGNSNTRTDYSVVVSSFDGKMVYKLEQTDIDGTVKTLGVVELDNSSKADLDMISLFPNSTSNSIIFKGLPGQFRGEFSLYSLNGLRVFYSSVSEE
jgi:hypothetical protein